MSDLIEVAARVIAANVRQAVLTQQKSSLSPDPESTFGIAPIRVVSEQQVQAIAFGQISGKPQIVTRWNPLSRESGDLEPFALAFNGYLETAISLGHIPRIWVPHRAAFEVIEILGHRYRTNQMASLVLRQMGSHCMALAEEERFAGQQVVVIAADLLRSHLATGQSPTEDRHIGALLAWIAPPDDVDVEEEAARRALVPAAAMLERSVDDLVEGKRRLGKKQGPAAEAARQDIRQLLRDGARREWDLLVEARNAFWNLGVPPNPLLGPLINASTNRIAYSISQARNPRSRPSALARLLDTLEEAAELAEDAQVRGDSIRRERARRQGRVFNAQVVSRDQPRTNCHPCRIQLLTAQDVLRIRRDTKLRTLDGDLVGVVTHVSNTEDGDTLIELKMKRGVRGQTNRNRTSPGWAEDWCDSVVEDRGYQTMKIHRAVRDAASPLVFGDALPPAKPRSFSADLVAIAAGLRRS